MCLHLAEVDSHDTQFETNGQANSDKVLIDFFNDKRDVFWILSFQCFCCVVQL